MRRFTRLIALKLTEEMYFKLREKAIKEKDTISRIIRELIERAKI